MRNGLEYVHFLKKSPQILENSRPVQSTSHVVVDSTGRQNDTARSLPHENRAHSSAPLPRDATTGAMCSYRAAFLSAAMITMSSAPGLSATTAAVSSAPPTKVRSTATTSVVAPSPARTATSAATAGVAAASRLPALGPLLLLLVVGNHSHAFFASRGPSRTKA